MISSFVYRKGLQDASWSYAAAVGIFNSVINLILLITANWFSKKTSKTAFGSKGVSDMVRKSFSEHIFDFCNHVFLSVLVIVTIYPLLHVLFASLSDPMRFMAHQGLLLKPYGFQLESYRDVFKNPNIISGYINTLFIVVVGTFLNVYITAFGAYFLSRKNVMWRNAVMIMAVVTMFFSGGLIPFYLTVRQLGLDNSLWALILPVSGQHLQLDHPADGIHGRARRDGGIGETRRGRSL